MALCHWGNVIEDFLEPQGITLQRYCSTFRGSWVFGYVDALRLAGVRSLLVLVSKSVDRPTRLLHGPTGAPVLAIPPSLPYRLLSRRLQNPYARNGADAFGLEGRLRRIGPLLEPLREMSPYLATPLLSLVRGLHRERCEALLCQEYEFPRFDVCALLARYTSIPLFGVFQSGNYRRWRLERFTRPWAIRACRGLICPSDVERRRVLDNYAIARERVVSIPNPIDVGVWRRVDQRNARTAVGLPETGRIAVWHGRVDLRQKGLDVLLDAWTIVRRRHPPGDQYLVLVGDGPDAPQVRARIAADRLDDVIFVNELFDDREKLRTYLNTGDVYAFTSRHEGFPVAVVEAIGCGLPVVAADVSGIREIFPHGEASGGVIVAAEDAGAFADGLDRLLEEAGLTRSLGEQARQRAVSDFSLEAVGAQLRDFLLSPATDNSQITSAKRSSTRRK